MPLMVLAFLLGNVNVSGQTTVTYTMQTGNFNSLQTERNNNPPYSGTYNNNATEIGQYANGGSFGNTPGAAAFQTFSSSGAGSGTARTLKVGDRFTVTCFVSTNPSAGGYIGISFRASTTYTNFFSATDASTVARFQLDNTGNWKVYSGSSVVATSSSGPNADRTFSIEITSSNTFNATIGSETFYDLSFGTSGPISSFSIYTFGDSNANSFWKNGSLTNFGHSAGDGLRFGYGLSGASSSSISGIISDGITTNSTGTALVNVVRVGGSSGTSVALSGANTYTGATTVNANGTLRLGVSSSTSASGPLGTTGAGTTITSGGVLNMNGFSLTSTATEALTINGTGISSGGALINSSGTSSTWAGTVALGSDASVGGSGSTTLSGVVSGANSLTKVGVGTVTLSNTNTFGGASKSLTIAQGTVSINSFTNALGNSLNTFTLGTSSTSGTLSTTGITGNVSRTFTVAAGGGTLEIAGSGTPTFLTNSGANTGTLNGEFTVNCSSTGGAQFNLGLSGAGGLTINSSGSGVVTMGASGAAAATYSGDTKITSGKLELGLANMLPNSSKLVLNGGTFSTGATTGNSETVGTLQLTENSTILLGTGSHNLNFSASNLTAWTAGKTLTITGWTGTASGGTAGRIYVGSSGSGLTQAQLDAINFTGQQTGAQIISGTGEIVPNFTVTITSAQSGNWNSTSTWLGGVVPTSIDNVVIAVGHTVIVTADATCKKLNFTGTEGVVSVNTGITLTVSTSVNVDQADQNNAGIISGLGTLICNSINVGTSTPSLTAGRTTTLTSTISNLTSTGSITLTSRNFSSNNNNPLFYLQSGTLTCTDITTVHPSGTNTATISLTTGAATGTLKLSGGTPFTLDADGTNTISLNGSGATVEYSGAAQTVRNTSYTNLTLSGSGNKTMAAFAVSGKLSLQGTAAAITTSPSSIGTLEYKGSSSQTTTAIEWPSSGVTNVIIDNSAGVTMGSGLSRTISGSLTLTSGTLTTAANTLTYSGSSISRTIGNIDASNASGVIAFTNTTGVTLPASLFSGTVSIFTVNGSGGVTLGGNTTIGTLNLTSGTLTVGSANTVTINSGGSVARTSGALASGTGAGKFSFSGTGTVSSTVGFNDVDIAGGVNFGTASTINGTLTINPGGFVNTNAPIYANGSTLKYNSTGSYGRSAEWSATSGAGYPNNVQVSNNTTLNVRNGSDVARQIAGNLTVDAGSTLSLEGMNSGSFEIGLTVVGNVLNNGNITLATSTERLKCVDFSNNVGATTTLSSNAGGDLELTGSLIDNATFNSNNRAVFFTGSGVQDVSGTGTFNIDYIVSNKASGSIRMLTNLLVEGPNGGNAITLTNSSDILNLNGFSLTLGKENVASTISGNGFILGNSGSSMSILGSGALGTIRFDQTTPGTTNALNNFTINRTTTGSIVLGNTIAVSNALTITNGNVNLGTNIHTAGSLSFGGVSQTTDSSYGGTGSPAGTINTTYFAATTGVVNVGACTAYSITSTTVSSPACSSGASITLSNTTASNLPIGTYAVYYTLNGTTTGSFNATMTVSTAGSGTFSTGALNAGSTTITIDYLRNGCVSKPASGNTATFTVNANNTAGAASSTPTLCISTALTAITHATTGATGIGTATGLPSGVSASWASNTITISGTPTASGTFGYSIPLTGGCGSVNATGTITVTAAPASAGNNGTLVLCSGTTLTTTLLYNSLTGSPSVGGTWSPTIPTSGSVAGTYTYTQGSSPCVVNAATVTVTDSEIVTWNGSWSPSVPTASTSAVIESTFETSENITACSLRVTNGATVVFLSGAVTLNGPIIAESSNSFVTFNNNAILLQNGSGYVNTGNINYKKASSPIFRLDYTLWSSPLTAASQPIFDFSPQTLTNRFYTYNEATNFYTTNDMYTSGTPALSASSSFKVGRGYLIRSPNNWVSNPNSAAAWTGTFTGVPNNGDIAVTINKSVGATDSYGYNAVGNPYPSPISIASFLSDNSGVIGSTLWLWRKTNGVSGSAYITYSAGTYSSGSQSVYNIQPGQGFFVRATSSGSLQFKNSQRVGTNGLFFRNNLQTTAAGEGRLWLNLKSNAIVVGNMALGYKEGATNDLDLVYDGEYLNDSPLALTSSLPGKELSVQHRAAPFVDTDVVPLSFKTDVAGTYSIDFNGTDGVLDTQDVYLEDLLLGQSVAIKTTPYTFTSAAGTFSDRFRIVYMNSALGTDEPVFNANQVVIYKNEINDFVINSGNVIMSNIKVYDVRGRLLQEYKNVNDSETTINVGSVNQVLLVQITSEDGVMVTKKVIR